ncbi:MAG: hypothetical protein AAED33_03480 [Paracoccaceae bacterium]|jgi:hypothetical protein
MTYKIGNRSARSLWLSTQGLATPPTEPLDAIAIIEFSIPDGPLGSGKELHIEETELTEKFRSRIREAYVDAWGCEHRWVEVSPEDADL